jgi:hypothetical protein
MNTRPSTRPSDTDAKQDRDQGGHVPAKRQPATHSAPGERGCADPRIAAVRRQASARLRRHPIGGAASNTVTETGALARTDARNPKSPTARGLVRSGRLRPFGRHARLHSKMSGEGSQTVEQDESHRSPAAPPRSSVLVARLRDRCARQTAAHRLVSPLVAARSKRRVRRDVGFSRILVVDEHRPRSGSAGGWRTLVA